MLLGFARISLLLAALLLPCACWAWSGQVVDVHDGDSLRVRRADTGEIVRVRIYGVDCPELAQPYGADARELTAGLVLGQLVEVVPTGQRPSYGREVAGIVLLEKLTVLQDALVTAGLAWVDGRYCKADVCDTWRTHQNDARTALPPRGLWNESDPVPPWKWRRMR